MALTSLILALRPREAVSVPSALGRGAHAALLDAVRAVNPDLSQKLHDDENARPFTCSSLMGNRQNGALVPTETYTLRYTTLTRELADLVPILFAANGAGIAEDGLQIQNSKSEIVLDAATLTIERATTDAAQHPWAANTDYEHLSARWLLAREMPESRLTMHLASPTAFKSGGKMQPLPLPDLVFGSLLAKWNAFAPVTLPDEARRFAAECLAVSRFEISTFAAPFKSEGALKIGAVGTVTYSAINRDRYWLSVINLLADFAQFAGVGVNTAMGMGQVRRIVG
jgi:CRISPR-associated endoribonuclease Cas6